MPINQRIKDLCRLITAEKDSNKLLPLIDEIRKLLIDEKAKSEKSTENEPQKT